MSRRYLLGFDVGSSSVKASLVDADSGVCAASAFYPESEAPIMAKNSHTYTNIALLSAATRQRMHSTPDTNQILMSV